MRGLFGKDRVEGLPADLTDEKQVQKLVYETQRSFSKVDILVNNAGMVQVGHDQPSSKFEKLTFTKFLKYFLKSKIQSMLHFNISHLYYNHKKTINI